MCTILCQTMPNYGFYIFLKSCDVLPGSRMQCCLDPEDKALIKSDKAALAELLVIIKRLLNLSHTELEIWREREKYICNLSEVTIKGRFKKIR